MDMTETLLQKLEEKMMLLLSELEDARREMHRLNHENALLKAEKENHANKLADLISLLETVSTSEMLMPSVNIPVMKPVLVQG
jgi:regulator of replication initiation timing